MTDQTQQLKEKSDLTEYYRQGWVRVNAEIGQLRQALERLVSAQTSKNPKDRNDAIDRAKQVLNPKKPEVP